MEPTGGCLGGDGVATAAMLMQDGVSNVRAEMERNGGKFLQFKYTTTFVGCVW